METRAAETNSAAFLLRRRRGILRRTLIPSARSAYTGIARVRKQ